jgi:hypothetical protein
VQLYKYLSSIYLDIFLDEGLFLFRSLSYFQDCEDDQVRGDKYEGTLKHSRKEGLLINNLTTNKTFKSPFTFESAVDEENIYVFCVSKKLSAELAKEFKSDSCVEILNSDIIISNIQNCVANIRQKSPEFIHGEVVYYKEEEDPGINWALPEKIVMRKLEYFKNQDEYRFSFSLKDAFGIEKTTQSLTSGKKEKKKRDNPCPDYQIKVGNIRQYCRIHKFT